MYNEEGESTFYIPRHTSLVRLSYYNRQEGQIEEEEEGKKTERRMCPEVKTMVDDEYVHARSERPEQKKNLGVPTERNRTTQKE